MSKARELQTGGRRGGFGRRRGSRGTTLVETAIVLPLLLLLVFGLIEYGWMFLKAQETTGAARHGARLAILPDSDWSEGGGVRERVYQMLESAGIEREYVEELSITLEENEDGPNEVRVRVYVGYENVRLVGFIPTPNTIGGSVTMAMEGPGN